MKASNCYIVTAIIIFHHVHLIPWVQILKFFLPSPSGPTKKHGKVKNSKVDNNFPRNKRI
jgi:hypothetical protein